MHLWQHPKHDFWNADFIEVKLKDSLHSKCLKNSSHSLQTGKQENRTGLEKKTNTSNKTLEKTQEYQNSKGCSIRNKTETMNGAC